MQNYWSGKSAVVMGGAWGQGGLLTRLLLEAGSQAHVMNCLPPAQIGWQVAGGGGPCRRGLVEL